MSNNDNTISATLQILFGITGIFSVVVSLFGLHHRDSLVFVLYRRLRSRGTRAVAYSVEDGIASPDANVVDQGVPVRAWTDLSQRSSDACLAVSSLSETTTNSSNPHSSSRSTVVGAELAEPPGGQQ